MLIIKFKTIFNLLICVLLSIGLFASSSIASSQSILRPEGVPEDYPNKEIEFIYGFSPGSLNDAYIRLLTNKIQELEGWNKGFIISYKEGAGGRISWSAIANAKPDGYVIGFVPTAAFVPAVAEDVDFGFDTYSYVFNMMADPGAIGVSIDSPYNSLQELIDATKENPGKLSFGVTSVTGQEGLTLKLIKKAADANFKIIAFNGANEVMASVIGKHVDAFCLNVGDTTNFIEDGKIKVLATGADERSVFLPDVPTYQEAGYDVVQVNMRSFAGPAGIPEPIRKYLENCFMAAAEDPEVVKKATDLSVPVYHLRGDNVKEKFAKINDDLGKLWESDPWQ